jgi:hypothetical protein
MDVPERGRCRQPRPTTGKRVVPNRWLKRSYPSNDNSIIDAIVMLVKDRIFIRLQELME